jgi:hypothetical protein
MVNIEVLANGTLMIDGVETEVAQLTQQLLEKIVQESLNSNVTYTIEGDMPIAQFFEALNNGTREGSELRRLKDEADKLEREATERGKKFVDGKVAKC